MNLAPDEIRQIRTEFIKAYNFDEDIKGLREQKKTGLNEVAGTVGIQKSFVNRAYRLWCKQREGEDDLDQIITFLEKLED